MEEHSFITDGAVRLTPAQANWIVTNLAYERQRPIEIKQVTVLREMMQRGQWTERSPIDFARMPDGRMILVNGHHRMTAQAQSHRDIIWQIIVRDVPHMLAVQALYYTYDTNVRQRTSQNILAGIGYAESNGLSKTFAKNLYEAAPILAAGLSMGKKVDDAGLINRRLIDERLPIMNRYAEAARQAEDAFGKAPGFLTKKLQSAAFFSVVLATFYHQSATADRFWRGMANDDGLAKGDPRKTLLDDVRDRNTKSGLITQNMIIATRGWNAFFEAKKLGAIRVSGAAPIPLAGTPFVVRP